MTHRGGRAVAYHDGPGIAAEDLVLPAHSPGRESLFGTSLVRLLLRRTADRKFRGSVSFLPTLHSDPWMRCLHVTCRSMRSSQDREKIAHPLSFVTVKAESTERCWEPQLYNDGFNRQYSLWGMAH